MDNKLLTIRQAAEMLGVSIDTLRRWDKSGKLVAIRQDGGTHRYYNERDLELFSSDLFKLASKWAFSEEDIPAQFYCPNSAVFNARLIKMQDALPSSVHPNVSASLLVAVAGEIGNNSFDHNLGNWPDVPGIFFGYDLKARIIILADRGLGLLGTLKRVKPALHNHQQALETAFTEVISGRAPEERGNGLKFVRKVMSENPITLFFQSGDAELRMAGDDPALRITRAAVTIRGCLVKITY